MPPRRRRDEAPRRRSRRHWPIVALFVLGVLAGVALWAYSPSLPAETLVARYANDRSKFIDVGGVRAHVREQGDPDGIPIVLIHGSMGSLHMWEGWVRELSSKARLISVDLPGHGLTGAWPRDEYTIEAYADFVEVLVDELNLDRFVLVGHSMGGAVAWTFAATRPDRVSQLILVDAAGYPRTRRGAAAHPPGAHAGGRRHRHLFQARAPRAALAERGLCRPGDGDARAHPPLCRAAALPGNREATLQRARTQEPLDPAPLRRLDVPTLILWGGKDRWVPTADAFRFQNDIKGAELEIFEALGHNPMEEDPKATAAAVAAFIKPITPRPTPPPEPAADQTVHPSVLPEKD